MSAFYELRPKLCGRDAEFWSEPKMIAFEAGLPNYVLSEVARFGESGDCRVLAVSPVGAIAPSYSGDSPEMLQPHYFATVIYQQRTIPQGEGET